jgi:hypothetical protein
MIQFHEITGLDFAKPNNICYTAVINACAYSDPLDKRTALKITISTYKALQTSPYDDVRPNSATYVNMLTALRNLLEKSNERDSAVKAVFMDACNNGYADQMLVQRLKCKIDSPRNDQNGSIKMFRFISHHFIFVLIPFLLLVANRNRASAVMTAMDIQDMLLPNVPNVNTEDLRLAMLPSDWRRNVD